MIDQLGTLADLMCFFEGLKLEVEFCYKVSARILVKELF